MENYDDTEPLGFAKSPPKTLAEMVKEFEAHKCDSPTDICECQFYYNCVDCGFEVWLLGESVPDVQMYGHEYCDFYQEQAATK